LRRTKLGLVADEAMRQKLEFYLEKQNVARASAAA